MPDALTPDANTLLSVADHCLRSRNDAGDTDVVMACAGDVPTLEALAAVTLLRADVPDIRIRFVNVVDLMVLQPPSEHPHGLADRKLYIGEYGDDMPEVRDWRRTV